MKNPSANKYHSNGFTLIELSIVLVIIGLIVGGVLVGRDLIKAAEVRAQVTQIEKFNTATNTFRGKYGALPGDIPAALVTQIGFTAAPGRAGTAALGDGNGLIEGINMNTGFVFDIDHMGGEQIWFWEDLSTNSNLIEGAFNTSTATVTYPPAPATYLTGSALSTLIPPAKLGNSNYIIVQANGGQNYFVISSVSGIVVAVGDTYAAPGLSSAQAFAIDNKLDDGQPQSGRITAQYANQALNGYAFSWAAGGGVAGISPGNAATASATSCYDNGGNASNPMAYSITYNNGNGVNCALSFQFQ